MACPPQQAPQAPRSVGRPKKHARRINVGLAEDTLAGVEQFAEESRWSVSFAAEVLIEEALAARAEKVSAERKGGRK